MGGRKPRPRSDAGPRPSRRPASGRPRNRVLTRMRRAHPSGGGRGDGAAWESPPDRARPPRRPTESRKGPLSIQFAFYADFPQQRTGACRIHGRSPAAPRAAGSDPRPAAGGRPGITDIERIEPDPEVAERVERALRVLHGFEEESETRKGRQFRVLSSDLVRLHHTGRGLWRRGRLLRPSGPRSSAPAPSMNAMPATTRHIGRIPARTCGGSSIAWTAVRSRRSDGNRDVGAEVRVSSRGPVFSSLWL